MQGLKDFKGISINSSYMLGFSGLFDVRHDTPFIYPVTSLIYLFFTSNEVPNDKNQNSVKLTICLLKELFF